jgi:hypothetical protein
MRAKNYEPLLSPQKHQCQGDFCRRKLQYDPDAKKGEEGFVSLGNYFHMLGSREFAEQLGLDMTQVSDSCPQPLDNRGSLSVGNYSHMLGSREFGEQLGLEVTQVSGCCPQPLENRGSLSVGNYSHTLGSREFAEQVGIEVTNVSGCCPQALLASCTIKIYKRIKNTKTGV